MQPFMNSWKGWAVARERLTSEEKGVITSSLSLSGLGTLSLSGLGTIAGVMAWKKIE